MSDYHPPNQIPTLIQTILYSVDQNITILGLIHKLPNLIADKMSCLLYEEAKQLAMQQPILQKTGMKEDKFANVPRINKDNLMPKDVAKQQNQLQQQPSPHMVKSTQSSNGKKSILGKSSLTFNAKLKSISLSEKKTIMTTRNKNQTKCEILKFQIPEEDGEVYRLRDRTEARLQFLQEQNKMRLQRQKSFKEKLMEHTTVIQDSNGNFTYHYNGDSVKSTIDQDKIKNYAIRAGMGVVTTKLNDSFTGGPVECKIEITKTKRQRERQQDIKPMNIPVLPASLVEYTQQANEYKLYDYKKHFGRRYSRLDHLSHTIDLNSSTHIDNKEQIFTQRKHLRDSSSALAQSKKTIDNKFISRKLALPRLRGKYKVLDRYQQI